ncbi:MAG TPA: Wzz/FepE/Etk N-terminal domain-containing protein [Terracidiphilus sp.]|jgi:uncharacterized protein involved in exopolysaccharide biosynthesis
MQSPTSAEQIEAVEAESASSNEVHFLDLLILFLKHKLFILKFTAVTAILATIAVLVIPSRYTAETIVLPPGQSSSLSSALLSQLGGSGALAAAAGASLGIQNTGAMYVSLFRTRTVEDSLIQRFGLMARYHKKRISDARKAFESRSTVSLGSKDGLISISVTDRDPTMAADLSNGYVDELRKLSASLAITEASQRRTFFQQQLLEANQDLATAEEAMKHTEQSTGVLQVDAQARSLIESAAVLRGQIAAKEVELQGMRTFATEGNPEIVMANEQLAALKAQLARLAGSEENSSSEIMVPKGNIPEAGMEYVRKLRDVKYYETVAALIARQYEVAKLDEARQGVIIQVVDLAVPPDKRSFPQRTITIVSAIFVGFFAACGWCIIARTLERMKSNPEERKRLNDLRAALRSEARDA